MSCPFCIAMGQCPQQGGCSHFLSCMMHAALYRVPAALQAEVSRWASDSCLHLPCLVRGLPRWCFLFHTRPAPLERSWAGITGGDILPPLPIHAGLGSSSMAAFLLCVQQATTCFEVCRGRKIRAGRSKAPLERALHVLVLSMPCCMLSENKMAARCKRLGLR